MAADDNTHRSDTSRQRREEILSAAAVVFDARGYSETTMEDIARQAGISKGSIYNYFPSKQALFREVFTDAVSMDDEVMKVTLAQDMSTVEKVSRLLELWYERLNEYIRIGRLVLEFWATAARQERTGEASHWFSTMYTRRRENLAALLQEGMERGEFTSRFDPSVAAALIISLLRGVTVQAVIEGESRVDRDFLDALKRAVLAGLTGEIEQGA
ncbi:MAG: TetR/AcrR family transcriptional regulator [Phycisphaerae bacterium]